MRFTTALYSQLTASSVGQSLNSSGLLITATASYKLHDRNTQIGQLFQSVVGCRYRIIMCCIGEGHMLFNPISKPWREAWQDNLARLEDARDGMSPLEVITHYSFGHNRHHGLPAHLLDYRLPRRSIFDIDSRGIPLVEVVANGLLELRKV